MGIPLARWPLARERRFARRLRAPKVRFPFAFISPPPLNHRPRSRSLSSLSRFSLVLRSRGEGGLASQPTTRPSDDCSRDFSPASSTPSLCQWRVPRGGVRRRGLSTSHQTGFNSLAAARPVVASASFLSSRRAKPPRQLAKGRRGCPRRPLLPLAVFRLSRSGAFSRRCALRPTSPRSVRPS